MVQQLGARALPTRKTALGRALRDWRDALVTDLGGADAVTTQQAALIEMAVRTKLMADSVDAYVLGMPSLVNKQKRCLHPVVRERATLVNQLQAILRDLGLERKAKSLDLAEQFAALHASAEGPTGETKLPEPPKLPTLPSAG